ncbi:gluconate 2-dehydrogenase subunit 3 family protein [Fibrella sp. HMF5335]|uniref:Gluconate 2-dehydrogenase subunit 3 family protein n=1 Tax=Fibrella rubiginis TaxID=2817060 RepID=A0A939K7X0_9BACT|nr:gluconate 2-dehydrogenase subunit 3 family protein [Fibrella rubiginis]MBO0939881.1 gluconate 2-dehydrogenase subunit 3 family protein [Fibrella rubiginis]
MASFRYPIGTVRALLDTDHVTPATRQALQTRLDKQPEQPQFFTPDEADLLHQLSARLFPQPDTRPSIDVVSPVDHRLAHNESDGWRYDLLPADPDAWRQGLNGFQEAAQAQFGKPFTQLDGGQQDDLIGQIQQGTAIGTSFTPLQSKRFFEDMLAELVSLYFSHPLAQEEFGYVGMADKPRWDRVGLNELEAREPGAL